MHGPCSGTYIINPNQLRVKLPSNVDDDTLDADGAYTRPLTVLTDMSYLLLRHRIAEVCRNITDAACRAGVAIEQLDYDDIMRLDRELKRIDADVPLHLRLDEESRLRSKALEKEKPCIMWQRRMVQFGLNSKRSQLHRAYLGRGFRDSRFSYSRKVCIDCARIVLAVDRDFRQSSEDVNPKMLQIWMVVHHLFLAGLVLALDLRFNVNDAEREREVVQCCESLELRQKESEIARRGAQQLRKILHDVSLANVQNGRLNDNDSNTRGIDPAAHGPAQGTLTRTLDGTDSFDFMTDFNFDEFIEFGLGSFGVSADFGNAWGDIPPLSYTS